MGATFPWTAKVLFEKVTVGAHALHNGQLSLRVSGYETNQGDAVAARDFEGRLAVRSLA